MSSSQLSTDRLRVNTSRQFDDFLLLVSYLTRSIFNISDQCLCKNVKLIHEEKSKIES